MSFVNIPWKLTHEFITWITIQCQVSHKSLPIDANDRLIAQEMVLWNQSIPPFVPQQLSSIKQSDYHNLQFLYHIHRSNFWLETKMSIFSIPFVYKEQSHLDFLDPVVKVIIGVILPTGENTAQDHNTFKKYRYLLQPMSNDCKLSTYHDITHNMTTDS